MSRKGFTLLEVLAVMVVIAILASMTFSYLHFVESARIDLTRTRVHTLGTQVGVQLKVKGKAPATLEELIPSMDSPVWVKEGKLVDAWDHPFGYRVDGKDFDVWSNGPDGISGTADDLHYVRK